MGHIADLFNEINLAQQARKQLQIADRDYSALEARIQVLESENLKLQAEVNPTKRDNARLKEEIERTHKRDEYKMVYGCMKFEGDEKLYCPGCFFDRGKKIPTGRKNIKYRFCAACKTDIPAG